MACRSHHVPIVLMLAALTGSVQAADIVVDVDGGGDFTDLQAAVDSALANDLIVVRPGTYAGPVVIDGKPLWVVADQGRPTVTITDTLEVENLAAGGVVVLYGLTVLAPSAGFDAPSPGLRLTDNAGEVRLQDCLMRGSDAVAFCRGGCPGATAGCGAEIVDSFQVTLTTSSFVGGEGGNAGQRLACVATAGAHGVVEQGSSVAAWGCEFRGGDGGDCVCCGDGADGGDGYRATSFGVFAAGSSFFGGEGGCDHDIFPKFHGGDGGDALYLPAMDTQARLLDDTLQPGAGGCSFDTPGSPGAPVGGGGSPVQLSGAARLLDAPAVVQGGASYPIEIQGEQDDVFRLRMSGTSKFTFAPQHKGFDLVDVIFVHETPIGTIPVRGALSTSYTAPPLPAGVSSLRLYAQGLVTTTSEGTLYAAPLHFVVVP